MALPASFMRDGFLAPSALDTKLKHLLVATEGQTDTGKTEFGMSAPGPIIILALDRMYDGVLDNATPPPTRRSDIGIKVIQVPLQGTTSQKDYVEYWDSFYKEYKKALSNPDVRTVLLDGDSDSWELQRLGEFGRLEKVPALKYVGPNASRRAMIAKAFDSGKIVIATNKIKDMYMDKINPTTGQPERGNDGNIIRIKSGEQEAQGFSDQDYLWHVRLRHLYKPAYVNSVTHKKVPQQWGVRILKAKANTALKDLELWGEECNFKTLVELIYPNVPLSRWGY